jgi:putative ABC transport system substrate-binding protein
MAALPIVFGGDSVVDRRTFIANAATGVLAMPLGAFAQSQGKVWRVGFFYFGSRQSALDTGRYNAFVQGMRELGYVDGKNVAIEARFGDGKIEHAPGFAADLVRLKVDVIVATGSVVNDHRNQSSCDHVKLSRAGLGFRGWR